MTLTLTHIPRGQPLWSWAADNIKMHHYLRRLPDPRTSAETFVIMLNGERVGALIFGRPEATRCADWYGSVEDVQATRCEVTRWQVLNLARVWIDPIYQAGAIAASPTLFPATPTVAAGSVPPWPAPSCARPSRPPATSTCASARPASWTNLTRSAGCSPIATPTCTAASSTPPPASICIAPTRAASRPGASACRPSRPPKTPPSARSQPSIPVPSPTAHGARNYPWEYDPKEPPCQNA